MPRLLFILALFLLSSFRLCPAAADETLTIIHQNDLHGWIFPAPNRKGFADTARLLEVLFKAEPSSFYAMAGDLFTGPDLAPERKGKMETELWNAFYRHLAQAGFGDRVLISLGNHEFDYGLPDPANFASPLLCANLVDADNQPRYTPFRLIKTSEGLRVGFIGLLLENNAGVRRRTEAAGLHFIPMLTAVENALDRMGSLDLTVLMIHDHMDNIMELARRLPRKWGVDLIVAGHDHLLLEKPLRAGDIPICEAGSMNGFYGRLNLSIRQGLVTALEDRIIPWEQDRLGYELMRVKEEIDARSGEAVALLKHSLVGSYLRPQESNLGDFVTDAFRWATGTDIAMTNSASLRMDFPVPFAEGMILREGDLRSISPFQNRLVTTNLSGGQLLRILEGEAADFQNQVSGLTYSVDDGKAAGKRVDGVLIGGKALNPDARYTLTHNAYCARPENMQRYLHLPAGDLAWEETRWLDYESLIGYAGHLKVIDYPARGMGRVRRLH